MDIPVERPDRPDNPAEAGCPDCGTPRSGPHADQCDVAECLATGLQRLSCPHDHDHGQDTWTGTWPGEADAVRLGLWAVGVAGEGWVACEPGTPGAVPDLNTLFATCVWSPASVSWERPLA